VHPIAILLLIGLLIVVGPYVLTFLFIAGALVAFVVGAVEYFTASIAGFTPYGSITHLRIEPPPESDDGPDPAYRSYYAGPVLLDYRKVLKATFEQVWAKIVVGKLDENTGVAPPSLVNRVWLWVKRTMWPKLLSVPCAIAASAGLIVGAVGAIGFVAVASLIFAALLVVVVLGALATGGGSRLIELALLYIRGITIECGVCHVRATRPVYRCPKCRAAHRRLLPGLSGVLHRTCRCHATLPTLLALGKTRLPAQYAECHAQLPIKGLSAPTVHIPVIAGPTAGKSVFMQTAITRLMLMDDGFEFADQRARDDFERNLRLGVTDDPRRAVKTVNTRPRAYNVFVGKEGSRARRLLYLYDPAGESVESVEQLADAQFLAFTKGVVFIVDPFALRQVRSATDRALLGRVNASNAAPKDVLGRFVEALRERMATGRSNRMNIPVAVVLTKADGLLDVSAVGHPYAGRRQVERLERDSAAREWLVKLGQRDLVSSLDNYFSAVSYFAVSYRDAREVTGHRSTSGPVFNDDPAEPVLWLLERRARR
jgi:Double-GTPase 2